MQQQSPFMSHETTSLILSRVKLSSFHHSHVAMLLPLPGFGSAPQKSSSKTKLLFQCKNPPGFQWESGSVTVQTISLEACKQNNYTSSVIPITQAFYFFFEVGGKETFYLGKKCYSDSKGGKKQLCLWKTHFHYNVLTHITEIIYVCDDKVFPSLHCWIWYTSREEKGEMLWIRNALPNLPLVGFYWLSALQWARGGTLVWLPSGSAHLNTLFTGFFCLPSMFTAGMESTRPCAPCVGQERGDIFTPGAGGEQIPPDA